VVAYTTNIDEKPHKLNAPATLDVDQERNPAKSVTLG